MDEWEDHGTAEASSDRDRLSELPDSLILEILSLLGIKDVVRTSLLSKHWKNLWSTIPGLCLDFCEFKQVFRFQCIISSVLSQWKGSKILKFCLSLDSFIEDPSRYIDSWLLFAIKKQLGEVFLDFSAWEHVKSNKMKAYCLPQPLYSCSSITKLTLKECKLIIEENVQWNQLKRLKLVDPEILSGDAMDKILLGAPLLEELVLKSLYLFENENENFNIRSTSLKKFKIHGSYYWQELRIWAPNLLTLKIDLTFYGTCWLDVPSLTHAILNLFYRGDEATRFEMYNHVFRSIRHVEKLTLLSERLSETYKYIQLLSELKNKDMVMMPLLNSKILELYYVDGKDMFDLIGMMFPKLERLILHQGSIIHNRWALAKMPYPSPSLLHLKTFEATLSVRDPLKILLIQILLENAPILEKMVIRLIRLHTSDRETFILAQEKVLSMPRSSPTAQFIITDDFGITDKSSSTCSCSSCNY